MHRFCKFRSMSAEYTVQEREAIKSLREERSNTRYIFQSFTKFHFTYLANVMRRTAPIQDN